MFSLHEEEEEVPTTALAMPSTLTEGPSLSPDRPSLTSLPLDLILDIVDQLPASGAACLSLTCKSLYYSQPLRYIWTKGLERPTGSCPCIDCSSYPSTIDRNCDYFGLIATLKKDMPAHIDSDFCQKFHLKPRPKSLRPGTEWVTCPTAPQKGMYVSWPTFGVHLQFQDVQMVMSQHRLGGLHGAPLSSIAISKGWDVNNTQSRPLPCEFDLEPEIVDENLMIHVTQRLFFTKWQIERITKAFDHVSDALGTFKVCKHQSLLARYLFGVILGLFLDRRLLRRNPGWNRRMTALQRCNDCNTCFCLEAVYHGDWFESMKLESHVWNVPADGIELILHAWTLLGGCEHTFSPCWLTVAEQRGADGPIYPHSTMLKAKKTASEAFERVLLTRVQTQHSQMLWCLDAVYHSSLLATIDRAVALANDPFEAKHHELSKILRAARHKVGNPSDMEYLVEDALGRVPFWHGLKLFPFDRSKPLRTAIRIVKEHERNHVPPGPLKRLGVRVWTRLPGVLRRPQNWVKSVPLISVKRKQLSNV